MHDVRFGIETSLARAAAAAYEDVEIPAMLAPVKPYAGICVTIRTF